MTITLDPNLLAILELAKTNPMIANMALGSLPDADRQALMAGALACASDFAKLSNLSEELEIDSKLTIIPKKVMLATEMQKLDQVEGIGKMMKNIFSNIGNTVQSQYLK